MSIPKPTASVALRISIINDHFYTVALIDTIFGDPFPGNLAYIWQRKGLDILSLLEPIRSFVPSRANDTCPVTIRMAMSKAETFSQTKSGVTSETDRMVRLHVSCAVIAPTLLHISIPNKLNNESRKAYPSMLHKLCLQRRHCYYAATSQARKILRMLRYIQASWPSSTWSEVVCLNQAGTKGNIDLTTQQGHITNMDYGVIG